MDIQSEVNKIRNLLFEFLTELGKRNGINHKYTAIFSYLQIYGPLTQTQLKEYSGFSLSTISTSLNALTEMGVVIKKKNLDNRNYHYKLIYEEFKLIYLPFGQIVDQLNQFDEKLCGYIYEINALSQQYPDQTSFLINRLNTLRNYAEVQRRTIKKESKIEYQPEIIKLEPYEDHFKYVPKLRKIEDNIITLLINSQIISGTDSVMARIISLFITRGILTQDELIELTRFSRAMISRKLKQIEKWVKSFPKNYHQSRNYYFASFSLAITFQILNTDKFIFEEAPKILVHLENLEEFSQSYSKEKLNLSGIDYLIELLHSFDQSVNNLKISSKKLITHRNELANYLDSL